MTNAAIVIVIVIMLTLFCCWGYTVCATINTILGDDDD